MVILRATSILGGQKEDKGMMYSITLKRIEKKIQIVFYEKGKSVSKNFHLK
jgi:hypothetical protein